MVLVHLHYEVHGVLFAGRDETYFPKLGRLDSNAWLMRPWAACTFALGTSLHHCAPTILPGAWVSWRRINLLKQLSSSLTEYRRC